MPMDYQERQADPRWAEAGNLFDAELTQAPWWGRLSPHARARIRYAVCEAALGVPGAGCADPGAALEETVTAFVKMNAHGQALLDQCRLIARSAARAGRNDRETGP